jgi:hypothetical protein
MDIEMRLQSGQIHDPMAVSGPGSLVLPCFTCPTDRNQQKGWEADMMAQRYVLKLADTWRLMCIAGCTRLLQTWMEISTGSR